LAFLILPILDPDTAESIAMRGWINRIAAGLGNTPGNTPAIYQRHYFCCSTITQNHGKRQAKTQAGLMRDRQSSIANTFFQRVFYVAVLKKASSIVTKSVRKMREKYGRYSEV